MTNTLRHQFDCPPSLHKIVVSLALSSTVAPQLWSIASSSSPTSSAGTTDGDDGDGRTSPLVTVVAPAVAAVDVWAAEVEHPVMAADTETAGRLSWAGLTWYHSEMTIDPHLDSSGRRSRSAVNSDSSRRDFTWTDRRATTRRKSSTFTDVIEAEHSFLNNVHRGHAPEEYTSASQSADHDCTLFRGIKELDDRLLNAAAVEAVHSLLAVGLSDNVVV